MAEPEGDVLKRIMKAASDQGARVFRNNTGQAWVGKVVKQSATYITLQDYRVLNAGLIKGSSDAIGWCPVKVAPEMVGKQLALFLAIEAKTRRGVTTEDQDRFLLAVNSAGGIGFVSRGEVDLAARLKALLE